MLDQYYDRPGSGRLLIICLARNVASSGQLRDILEVVNTGVSVQLAGLLITIKLISSSGDKIATSGFKH